MTSETRFTVQWRDSGKEPSCPPNPAYPDGIDVNGSKSGDASCKATLPYPAKRIGAYSVECTLCGCRVMLTTAGRPDDPRSVTLPCRPLGARH